MTRGVAALVQIFALWGCADLTELVVVVDTDLSVPCQLDTIRLEVVGPDGQRHPSGDITLVEGDVERTFGLVTDGASTEPVEITVVGSLLGRPVVGKTITTGFVAGQSRGIVVELDRRCRLPCVDDGSGFDCSRCGPESVVAADTDPLDDGVPSGTLGAAASCDSLPSEERVFALDAGASHTCARRMRDVVCWGADAALLGASAGEAADRTVVALEPVAIPGAIAVGTLEHSCAALGSTIHCWGRNNQMAAIPGGPETIREPLAYTDGPEDVVELALGERFSCARSGDGTIDCWGATLWTVPPAVSCTRPDMADPFDIDFGDVRSRHACLSAGQRFVCGIQSGEVWCAGDGASYQLGNGATASADEPVRAGALDVVVDLSAGDLHACAIARGEVHCWGSNTRGQAAPDDVASVVTVPTKVGDITNAQAISAGQRHTCAVDGSRRVICWGDDDVRGPCPTTELLCDVGLTGIVDVAAGAGHTCAVDEVGVVSCWGTDPALTGRGGDPSVPAAIDRAPVRWDAP